MIGHVQNRDPATDAARLAQGAADLALRMGLPGEWLLELEIASIDAV